MCAEQDDAVPRLQRVRYVLDAVQPRYRRQVPVTRPAAEPHLDHHHAEGLHVLVNERVVFAR